MCIVGFDDTKFGGAFEIANSWGDDWANGGFIWIRYDDLYNMYPTFTKIGN
jgi:C1A family cysteine protease